MVGAWCEIDVNEWTRHDWTASERRQRIVWSFMVEIACLNGNGFRARAEREREEGGEEKRCGYLCCRTNDSYLFRVYVLA